MNDDLSKRLSVQVACGCGHVERVERWPLIDEVARPETVAELASRMPHSGYCSECGADLPNPDFFAVLRRCQGGPVCFIFSAEPNTPGITHEELVGNTEAARTIRLPFDAAPVVLARELQADLDNYQAAIAEVEETFGGDAANNYSGLLKEVGLIETDRRSGELVDLLSSVENATQFKQILAQNPELLGDEVLDYLDRLGSLESFRASLEVIASLLREARSDPGLAWQRYRQGLSTEEPAGDRIEEAMKALERLHDEERWSEAIVTARPALEEAQRLGYGLAVGMIHSQLGVALLRNTAGDRRADVEEAIEHLRLASQGAPSRQVRAKQLVNLAGAYGQRLVGDPNENSEEAIRLLERAAEQLDRRSEPREWSTLQTNLCRSLQVRESGKKVANLERALQHCEAALKVRSPVINAEDWAYSQINLGVTLQLLAEQGVRDIAEAREAFEEVLGEQDRVPRIWMAAQVLGALAELDRIEAHSAWEVGDTTAQVTQLNSALQHLREALELIDPAEHRLLYARLLNHLSDALNKRGDYQTAIEACEQALDLLTPQSAPVECQEVASRLGWLLTESADWDRAAEAYRQALAAAEITFHARLHSVGRQTEMRRQGNLARWAAYAVAKSGDVKEAVQILEGGRARELGRRISGEGIDSNDLDGLSEELADAYLAATSALASATLGDDSSGASRAVQEVLGEICRQPGFENFAKAADWEQIAAAAEPDWPLIYLNPTPAGTVLLCVGNDGQGPALVESIFRDTPQGTDVAVAVLFGGDINGGNGHSYLGTASGMTPDRDLGIALETLLPWLGAEFGSPVDAYLRRTEAVGATLVPCGLIGLTPIHAGTWRDEGRPKSLIEDFGIRYAASASMQVASLARRAKADARAPQLVALGNPTGADLDAAEGEVGEIAAIFGSAATNTAIGAAATSGFLLDHAAEATHLHLACHARGAAFDLDQSSIGLSDREVAATELAAVGPLRTRLTVASACQTAISEVADLPEEVISISSVLVGAGSACVIASLWSVDDYATALLMTRLYEEMEAGRDPVSALRHAQLWLVELDPAAEVEYLDSHPQLEVAFANRGASRHPARWRDTAPSLGKAENRYSHPVFWAPFIAAGA